MGINDLKLSPSMVAALYPETLVGEKISEPLSTSENKGLTLPENDVVYTYLGKNLRSICFLVAYPKDEFIPADQLTFLVKILAACQCSLDDIALINTKHHPVEIESLKRQLNPGIIFLWGGNQDINGIQEKFPDMTISVWGKISILRVLQVERMIRDDTEGQALKRILWVSLKKLFNL